MAAPYLIVGLAGDSNGMWGKYRLTDGSDDGGSRIFSMNNLVAHGNRNIVAANEPLQNLGYGTADGQTGQVGSTLALCRKLRDEGYLPDGYDILIVPRCWAGTAFLNFWATTGDRAGLNEFITSLNLALDTHADSRIWFFDWNHGANDGGQTETQYRDNMIATWAEIRATVPTASNCPILVPGLPPNRYNPALGGATNLGGVVAAQQNVQSYLTNSAYINVADRTELDTSNGYVHFSAVSHRGGTNNAPGNTSEVVSFDDSIAGRKFVAITAMLAEPPVEAYMLTPDSIVVVVDDTPPVRGNTVSVYQDESAVNYDTWVTRNNPRDGGAAQDALVIGNSKSNLRFADQLSTSFVDRMNAQVAGNWSLTGSGRTVTAVHYARAQPIDHGLTTASGLVLQVTLRHEFILQLDAPLAEGTYSFSNVTAGIPSTPFTFDDTITRAGGIIVSQVGCRVDDGHKMAILAARRPGGANGGAVDFATDYSFDEFNILDAAKTVVWSSGPGGIVLRSDPDDAEPGYTNIQVADPATERTITTITNDSPGVVTTSTNHGLINGDRVRFRGMPTGTWANTIEGTMGTDAFAFTVTKINDTQFSFGVNTTSFGAYTTGNYNETIGGHDSKVYKCYTSNRNGTYVYGMDFSAFEPEEPGIHYVQIPGYGISDQFLIHEAAYAIIASSIHKGLYAMRRGCAVTVGGFSRAANFKDDGSSFWKVYWTNGIGALSGEFSQFVVSPPVNAGSMCYAPAITTTRATLPNSGWGHQDAGDLDGYVLDHVPPMYHIAHTLHEMPEAGRHTNVFTAESANRMATVNPTRYAGTESWPALMQEVLWHADWLLNTQQVDGRCASGFGLGHFSSQSANYGENSGVYRGTHKLWGTDDQLAGDETNRVHGYICAADTPSNYWTAALFAKIAAIAYSYGNTSLGDEYKDAAVLAYDWAETMRNSHLGDGVVRDAYYSTTLDLKGQPVSGVPAKFQSVNTSTDVVTTAVAHGQVTGRKVRVVPHNGSLVAGLSALTDYWVNCPTTTTLSFHTNATDAGTGANKVDLTSGSAGVVFRTYTDAEYATAMAAVNSSMIVVPRQNAAGSLLRLLGPTVGSLYNFFVIGTPNDGTIGAYEYLRAYEEWPGELDTATYDYKRNRFFLPYADELGYNTSAQGFPRCASNVTTTNWSNSTPTFGVVMALFQAIKAADTTNRDSALLSLRAQAAFVTGRNAVAKCFVKGAGVRHAICHLHDDSFYLGVDVPDGNINYAWFLWPQNGSNIASWIGHSVGPLTWANDNVPNNANGTTYYYKCTEPWRAAGPFWYAQGEARGSIFLGEAQLHQTMVPNILAALAAHGWDGNAVNTIAAAVPTVRFRYRKVA